MKNILFICTGNTCRSPMAEALLKEKTSNVMVRSAGIFASNGQAASKGTMEVLKEKGISFKHQSQPVTPDLIQWADLILTMTTQHKQRLLMQHPHAQEKIHTLKEYVDEEQQRIWNHLMKAYAQLEDKRAQLNTNDNREPKQLEKTLQDDLDKIHQLEKQVKNPDIQDPFGGNVEHYRKTCEELEKYIELLLEKIDNINK